MWAVGDPVVASGILDVPGVLLTGLTLYSSVSESEFLAAVVDKAGTYNPLPASGWLEAGAIYGYAGGLVIVRQSHNRTEHAPVDVPALFAVYREDASEVLEWVPGEGVLVGTRRTFGDKTYQAIQAHTTQVDWTPPAVPALWAEVVEEPPVGAWAAGVAYVGDNTAGTGNGNQVTYSGRLYRCLQSHTSISTWYPSVVPALWLDLGAV